MVEIGTNYLSHYLLSFRGLMSKTLEFEVEPVLNCSHRMQKFQALSCSVKFSPLSFQGLFFYLFENVKTEKERQRERSSVCWLTFQMAEMTLAVPRLKPATWSFSSKTPTQGEGPKDLGCLPLLSQTCKRGAGSKVEELDLEPALLWSVSITDGSLT